MLILINIGCHDLSCESITVITAVNYWFRASLISPVEIMVGVVNGEKELC